MRAAVLGAGSWGTTFAKVLCDAGTATTLLARREVLADSMTERRENAFYLPGIRLPESLLCTGDPATAVDEADLIAIALPAQRLRENLTTWADRLPPDATYVSLMKGIELGSLQRMSEVIAEVIGVPAEQVCVLTGPNLAREIAEEQPTATVIAGTDEYRAREVQKACRTEYLRPYTNLDVIGCELGGSAKNVVALAVGVATGMGFGSNTTASLMTRGLAEVARLGAALGADPITFAGLAGIGDLVATCGSRLSRNRRFGERLGHGESVEEVQGHMHGQVAEGVRSSAPLVELADRHGVEMPIARAVAQICFGERSPADMVRAMMSGARSDERSREEPVSRMQAEEIEL